ncbi:hypothetical protein EZ449_03550 [Pedobacter frigidisoli]|uniref:DKNYY family protein n=1 Tax=Pedobacter frigidisoli TaxID=2530455 RepID=A0A4R0PB58_9SPHI|nr:hypothetical protein [Pedobacter frigidisoli]TCD12105.1 hypothetical protein EZ449_03550 [Pedobacter frigidisoli]
MVFDDEKALIVRDNQFYYLVAKELPYEKPIVAQKICVVSPLVKVKNSRLIRFNRKWHYIIPNSFVKQGFDDVLLTKLPTDFKIVYSINRDKGANYLIKSNKQVAGVNISIDYKNNAYSYNPIPKLNPLSTVFTSAQDDVDDNFLRDDRNFYLINYDLNFRDVTSQFIKEKKTGFNKMSINFNSFHEAIFSDGSNTLWIYFKDGISLSDGTDPNFMPIEAKFLNADNKIIVYDGKYYTDGWAAANEVDNVDLSKVNDKASLVLLPDGPYADKYQCYRIENYCLLPDGPLPAIDKMQKLSAISSYGSSMPALRVSQNFIYREENTDSISHTSAVKFLVKAYAFDDKILIENKLIDNPANREKMVFIGALANVIVPCDGGRGQNHAVIVKYRYFFKNDKTIYTYYSSENNLQVLSDCKPGEIKVDNFDDLQKLAKLIVKK